jgi:hypothetical protein
MDLDSIVQSIQAFVGNERVAKVEQSGVVEKDKGRTVHVALIVFSKDRPYQLHQLLRSVGRHLVQLPLAIQLIYVPGQYVVEYEDVVAFHRECTRLHVDCVLQSETTTFQIALSSVLTSLLKQKFTHVLFCVDDLLFFDDVDLCLCARALDATPTAFALHLKLNPGIVYSHSANKYCAPPVCKPLMLTTRDEVVAADTTGDVEWLVDSQLFSVFDYAGSKVEWRYPFDLCGSLYRLSDMHTLLALFEEFSMTNTNSNPNRFESLGNSVFWKERARSWSHFSRGICLTRSILSVVTVNQVQTTFKVPIYRAVVDRHALRPMDMITQESDLHFLNKSMLKLCMRESQQDQSINLDLDRYRNNISVTVHIGDLCFLDKDCIFPSFPSQTVVQNNAVSSVQSLLQPYG